MLGLLEQSTHILFMAASRGGAGAAGEQSVLQIAYYRFRGGTTWRNSLAPQGTGRPSLRQPSKVNSSLSVANTPTATTTCGRSDCITRRKRSSSPASGLGHIFSSYFYPCLR